MGREMSDYSGDFISNLKYEDFSKDALIRLLGEYSMVCSRKVKGLARQATQLKGALPHCKMSSHIPWA